MATNDRFRASIKRRIQKSKGKTEDFVIKLMLDIDAKLTAKSPVDTGRFKANWAVGSGYVNQETTDALSSAPKDVPAMMNQLTINSIKVNGQVIYITNSLPYANRLEYGWSDQAPGGMVRETLSELNSMANKIAVSLRMV